MKFIRGFFTFWRNFIIGDDNRVAIVIMWAMLATYSFVRINLPAWYVVPVVVIVLFIVLFYLTVSNRFTLKPTYYNKSMYGLFLPMALVLIFPMILFRLISADFGWEHLLVSPLLLMTGIVVAALLLGIVFIKYPALASFIAGVITFSYITFSNSLSVEYANWLVENHTQYTLSVVISSAIAILLGVSRSYARLRDRD